MCRKMSLAGLGAALVLVSMMVFTACGGSDDDPVENTEQVEILSIPAKVGDAAGAPDSYKIFVQLSKGMDADAGYVAKGDALISGTSVTMELKKPDGQPWADTGSFNLAVVLSPATVSTWEDILVYGGQGKSFSSQTQSFNLASGFIKLNDIMPTQVQQLYNGTYFKNGKDGEVIDTGQPGIICTPDSGIDYPGKP